MKRTHLFTGVCSRFKHCELYAGEGVATAPTTTTTPALLPEGLQLAYVSVSFCQELVGGALATTTGATQHHTRVALERGVKLGNLERERTLGEQNIF